MIRMEVGVGDGGKLREILSEWGGMRAWEQGIRASYIIQLHDKNSFNPDFFNG